MKRSWVKRAKQRMFSLGITQNALADYLGCTRGAIGHYLNGRRQPNLTQLEKMARLFETSPAWLIFGEGEVRVQEPAMRYLSSSQPIPVRGTTRYQSIRSTVGYLDLFSIEPADYGLVVASTRWSPRIQEGDVIIMRPSQLVAPGDELMIQQRRTIRLVNCVKKTAKSLTVSDIMAEERRQILPQSELQYIHVIIAVVRSCHIHDRESITASPLPNS